MLRTRKFWSLEVELEWLWMKPSEKLDFPLLLVHILICKEFLIQNLNMGKMHISNYLWSILQYLLDQENIGIWKLNHNDYELSPVKKYTLSSFISEDIDL